MNPKCLNCVLVVDDDPHILRLIVTFLKRQGYEVLEARNGREALAHMSSGDAHLVVLDLMMPDMNGWEVLQRRAADPVLQRIPVVVVTANSGVDVASVLDKDICALLPKPFSLEALSTIVRSCIQHPHGPPVAASSP